MAKLFLALDVDFDDDEKVARLARYTKPGEARACRDLLVAMWRYCKRERSNGKVPAEVVGKLVYPDSPKIGLRDADRLVEIGMAERTPEGYYLPSYLKRNKSREQLEEEAKVKAEAGRKGGLASGQARKGEADGKQPASSVLQPSEAIDRDIDTDRDKDSRSVKLGEERYEPLRAVPVTKPRPKCTAHPDGNAPGPCAACGKVREWDEKHDAAYRAAERDAALNCDTCHGTGWLEHPNTGLPAGRCNHRRTA